MNFSFPNTFGAVLFLFPYMGSIATVFILQPVGKASKS